MVSKKWSIDSTLVNSLLNLNIYLAHLQLNIALYLFENESFDEVMCRFLASVPNLHQVNHGFDRIWTAKTDLIESILWLGSNTASNITYRIRFAGTKWYSIIFQTIGTIRTANKMNKHIQ